MDTAQISENSTVPGYYVWNAPGKSVAVHLNLDVVDRLSAEVMTGFGAIPKRGAEVGGMLVGTIAGGIVRVEDFVPIACEYKRGPSYLLSEGDTAAFQEAYDRIRPEPGRESYAVGYYRSNTRDQGTLGEEDRKLCGRYFPPPSNVVLLIKPYASKVSMAGFITYENGRLDDESALEFAFRRHELEGASTPARRPLTDRVPRPDPGLIRTPRAAQVPPESYPSAETAVREPARPEASGLDSHYAPPPADRVYAVNAESRSARRRGWVWIPLSFIFLLLGVLLGFQAALTIYPKGGASPNDDPYSLALAVTRSDDNLHLKWDRHALPIRTAQRGVLEITDGSYSKKVDLDTTQLQNGSVIYRHLSGQVHFKIEVFPRDRISVTETADWSQ